MSHWYTEDAVPMHTVVGKNGKERATTLREARKYNLCPSVTTIMSVQDKPMLTQWLINELLNAAVATPYNDFEWVSEEHWRKHAQNAMREKSRQAAKRGTEIHNKLEDYFKTGNICKKDAAYITPAIHLIQNTFGIKEWIAEKTFVNTTIGFGGSVDLHCSDVIIDFKTKDKTSVDDMLQYDDHYMQLAAYAKGLKLFGARRFNLFISTNEETPGLCKLAESTELDRPWDMFYALTQFWQQKNKYKPLGRTE